MGVERSQEVEKVVAQNIARLFRKQVENTVIYSMAGEGDLRAVPPNCQTESSQLQNKRGSGIGTMVGRGSRGNIREIASTYRREDKKLTQQFITALHSQCPAACVAAAHSKSYPPLDPGLL